MAAGESCGSVTGWLRQGAAASRGSRRRKAEMALPRAKWQRRSAAVSVARASRPWAFTDESGSNWSFCIRHSRKRRT